jgi:5'-methylthioadenosine phosphorylase
MKIAIIGGTNIETLPIRYREQAVSTPYGDVVVFKGKLKEGNEVIFLSRHGVLYARDPGEINYRANIYALHQIGVTHVIGITSVGACDYSLHLGEYCLINDFLDFTKQRYSSFEREHRIDLHTVMDNVFSNSLNDTLEELISQHGLPYSGRAVYACMEGPRFETPAEARAIRMLGGQVVGQTIIPEAPLCRDLGMEYAALGLITNYCTGMTGVVNDVVIEHVMDENRADIFDLCFDLIRRMTTYNE